jgi:monofunctional biosynthetic peptidoglycan transglycosylase
LDLRLLSVVAAGAKSSLPTTTKAAIKKRASTRLPARKSRKPIIRRAFIGLALALAAAYGVIVLCLIALRWIDPPTTAVQIERASAARLKGRPYRKRYLFEPITRMSPNLVHAVLAAEDTRFFAHHGFDWNEIESSLGQDLRGGKPRGASTITQQLVRNLFLSTGRSVLRKAVEAVIVPPTEIVLGKQRILELYLNVVEWGPGVYGAEAASEYYFHSPASGVNRLRGAELAALLPAPLHRKPGQPDWYVKRVLARMTAMGY